MILETRSAVQSQNALCAFEIFKIEFKMLKYWIIKYDYQWNFQSCIIKYVVKIIHKTILGFLFRLCHEIEISNNHVKNFLYFFNKPIAHNAFRLCEFHASSARICKISKGRMHLQIDRTLRNSQNALHARSPKTQHIIWALPWVKPSRE